MGRATLPSLPLLAPGDSKGCLVYGSWQHSSNLCLPSSPCVSPLGVSCKTLVIEFRALLDYPEGSHLQILNLITSLKTPFKIRSHPKILGHALLFRAGGDSGTVPLVPRSCSSSLGPALNICACRLEPSDRSLSKVQNTGVELLGGGKCILIFIR